MSVSDNKALTRRFYDEGINQRNFDLIEELFSEDFVEHEQFPGLPSTGREAVRAAMDMFTAAFPDIQFGVDDMIGEDDKIVVRGRMSGTHQGEFMGIPATGKRVLIHYMDFWLVEDGRIKDNPVNVDFASILAQLGLDVFAGEGWEAYDRGEKQPPQSDDI